MSAHAEQALFILRPEIFQPAEELEENLTKAILDDNVSEIRNLLRKKPSKLIYFKALTPFNHKKAKARVRLHLIEERKAKNKLIQKVTQSNDFILKEEIQEIEDKRERSIAYSDECNPVLSKECVMSNCIAVALKHGNLKIIEIIAEELPLSTIDSRKVKRSFNLEKERIISMIIDTISSGKLDVIQFLFTKLLNIQYATFQDKTGRTGLLAAIDHHSLDVLQCLLKISVEAHVDIQQKNKDGITPLHYAASLQKFDHLQCLLQYHANPNVLDPQNQSPLFYSVKAGDLKSVRALIRAKADVNQRDNDGKTVLHLAVEANRLDIVECLLEAGASIDIPENQNLNTPFILACKLGLLPIVKYLAEKGSNLKQENENHFTGLFEAIENHHFVVFQYIDEINKVDFEKPNSKGKTPLHIAAKVGNLEVLQFLMREKRDLEIGDDNGNTPLMLAAINNKQAAFDLLISKGANHNTRNKKYSIFEGVVLNNNIELIKILQEKGVSNEDIFSACRRIFSKAEIDAPLIECLLEPIENKTLLQNILLFSIELESTSIIGLVLKQLFKEGKRSQEEEFIQKQHQKEMAVVGLSMAIEKSKLNSIKFLLNNEMIIKLLKDKINALFAQAIHASPEVLKLFLNSKLMNKQKLPFISLPPTKETNHLEDGISPLVFSCFQKEYPLEKIKLLLSFDNELIKSYQWSEKDGRQASIFNAVIAPGIKEYILTRIILCFPKLKALIKGGDLKKIQNIIGNICKLTLQFCSEFDDETGAFILPLERLEKMLLTSNKIQDDKGICLDSLCITPQMISLIIEQIIVSDPDNLNADDKLIEKIFWQIIQNQLYEYGIDIETSTLKLEDAVQEAKYQQELEAQQKGLIDELSQFLNHDPNLQHFNVQQELTLEELIKQIIFHAKMLDDSKILTEAFEARQQIDNHLDAYIDRRDVLVHEIQNNLLSKDRLKMKIAKELLDEIANDSILKNLVNQAILAWKKLIECRDNLLRLREEQLENEKKLLKSTSKSKKKTHAPAVDLVQFALAKRQSGKVEDQPETYASALASGKDLGSKPLDKSEKKTSAERIIQEQELLLQQKRERREKFEKLRIEKRKFFEDRQKREHEAKLRREQSATQSTEPRQRFFNLGAQKKLKSSTFFVIDSQEVLIRQAYFKTQVVNLKSITLDSKLFEIKGGIYNLATITTLINAKLHILSAAMEAIKNLRFEDSPFPHTEARHIRNVIRRGFTNFYPQNMNDLKGKLEFLHEINSFIDIFLKYLDNKDPKIWELISNNEFFKRIMQCKIIPLSLDDSKIQWQQYSDEWQFYANPEVTETILEAAQSHTYTIQGVIRRHVEDNHPEEFNAKRELYSRINRRVANKIGHNETSSSALLIAFDKLKAQTLKNAQHAGVSAESIADSSSAGDKKACQYT